jgi:hypothetical protein
VQRRYWEADSRLAGNKLELYQVRIFIIVVTRLDISRCQVAPKFITPSRDWTFPAVRWLHYSLLHSRDWKLSAVRWLQNSLLHHETGHFPLSGGSKIHYSIHETGHFPLSSGSTIHYSIHETGHFPLWGGSNIHYSIHETGHFPLSGGSNIQYCFSQSCLFRAFYTTGSLHLLIPTNAPCEAKTLKHC